VGDACKNSADTNGSPLQNLSGSDSLRVFAAYRVENFLTEYELLREVFGPIEIFSFLKINVFFSSAWFRLSSIGQIYF
jgi:hypothetical protein